MATLSSTILRALAGVLPERQAGAAVETDQALLGQDSHTSILTMNRYPPSTTLTTTSATPTPASTTITDTLIAAHTDVGVITILAFDEGTTGSLQVWRASDKTWVELGYKDLVPESTSAAVEGTEDSAYFVVNVGDCLSDLTGGALKSTLHRVVPCVGSRARHLRHSLAYFVGLSSDTMVLTRAGKSVPFEHWRRERVKRSMQVLKAAKAGGI